MEDELDGGPVGFAFWSSPGNKLPDVCRDGLQSAVVNAHFKLFLLSYGPVPNIPEGVAAMDANLYLEVPHCAVLTVIMCSG